MQFIEGGAAYVHEENTRIVRSVDRLHADQYVDLFRVTRNGCPANYTLYGADEKALGDMDRNGTFSIVDVLYLLKSLA